MFVATSTIQNSVWGWASKPLPTTGKGEFTTGMSRFSNYTLGPDGWVYALPCNPTIGASDQVVLALNPGEANSHKTNYSAATGQFITADGSPTRPTFMAKDATAGALFESKGVVAPNGKIYFFTKTHSILCELTPAGLSTTWKFYDFSVDVPSSSVSFNYFLGVILGKDGKLYLIPNGAISKLIRFDISGAIPVVETSYLDGSTGKKFNTVIKSPLGKTYTPGPSSDCYTATPPTGAPHWDDVTNPNNALTGSSFASSNMSAGLVCLDPVRTSNKIYFTIHLGTWIMWIDPDNWGNANVIGTVEDLWLRKLLSGYSGYRTASTVHGCANSGYKFGSMTPGANRKLYINITNMAQNGGFADPAIYAGTPNVFLQFTIEVDTVTNVATLRPGVTSSQVLGKYGGSDMMPNGYIFVLPNVHQTQPSVSSVTGSYHRKVLQVDTNPSTAVIRNEAYTTAYVDNPGWNNISIANAAGFLSTASVTNANQQVQFNNIVVLPGDKKGKVIIAGRNNTFGVELMSVKGFYKGVTHFDLKNTYDPANNVNKIEMPSNIATIATSDYNVYYNKIT